MGFARFGAVAVLGTVGVYGGLYGFAVGNRVFVVLGIALTVLAVTGWVVSVLQGSWWWQRRRPVWVAGSAEVRAASPPPAGGEFGRCELQLVVMAPGLASVDLSIRDSRVPVRSWPEVGDTLPIEVDLDNIKRTRVQWASFRKPEPAEPEAEERDDLAFDDPDHAYLDPPMFTEEELDALGYSDLPPTRPILPLEDEPTYLTARYLFPTERFRGEWRRHWVRPFTRYLLTLALTVAGAILVNRYVPEKYLTASRAGVPVLGGLIGLHVLFAWWAGRFVLTQKRVLLVGGVLRRRVAMAPLLRLTDLRFEQSTLGRLLNYGDFVLEGMGFFSRIRRIYSLPNPNELYLRVVEEMYEPEAVEARLGGGPVGDDEPQALTQAFREAIYGPPLVNYDGWVGIEMVLGEVIVPIGADRSVALEPDRPYRLRVHLASDPHAAVREPLVVTGGIDREFAQFTVELDSDQRDLRRPAQTIAVGPAGGMATFSLHTPPAGFADSPWLWVRVSQQHRLLQSVELIANVRVALG